MRFLLYEHIAKDLSRFGRNYIEAGEYLEKIFPFLGIRFIAVNDGYDSFDPLSSDILTMHLKNLVNSLYAKDCSRKTKAAHRARAKAEKYIGGHAPFGYIKEPNDRHKLIVDPPAADVVRQIFQIFVEGIGYVRMTKILREKNILNPQAYFNQYNPDYYKSEYWHRPFDWHATSVRVILSNSIYLGKLVFGKTTRKS